MRYDLLLCWTFGSYWRGSLSVVRVELSRRSRASTRSAQAPGLRRATPRIENLPIRRQRITESTVQNLNPSDRLVQNLGLGCMRRDNKANGQAWFSYRGTGHYAEDGLQRFAGLKNPLDRTAMDEFIFVSILPARTLRANLKADSLGFQIRHLSGLKHAMNFSDSLTKLLPTQNQDFVMSTSPLSRSGGSPYSGSLDCKLGAE
ncbi:hypothetical protein QBC35DRAFT_105502 [Podospora australis]|uniref:Uncharacterized protein n=1 Tax=Podospora australis TaxID=1536484 RepID=A0AAN6X5S4_9PEZI|nr:hypothetical protein QBC35DRAFT_105502 [Podospora australis]